MLTDRTTRSFFAAVLLVVGVIIAINIILIPDGLADWAWIAAFAALAGAAALAATLWLEDRAAAQGTTHDEAAHQTPSTQDWVIAKDTLPASASTVPSPSLAPPTPPPPPAPLVEEDAPTEDAEVVSATILEPTPAAVQQEHSAPVHDIAAANADGEDAPVVEAAQQGEPVAEQQVAEAMAAEIPPEVSQAESQSAAKSAGGTGDVPVAVADRDDLRRIEGIGPAYSEALHNAGISTFAQLSNATRETIEAAIRAGGYTRIPGSITTWAEQAALAAAGKWDELQTLQDSLSGGRR